MSCAGKRLHTQKRQAVETACLVLAPPIFPGRRQPSIVGRNELNYRVRNGNGWTLVLISTNFVGAVCGRKPGPAPYVNRVRPGQQTHYMTLLFTCQVPSPLRKCGDPYRIRTDVNGVRGRCLNHLTNGPSSKKLAPFRSRLRRELHIRSFLLLLRQKSEDL